jgi:hypothetical protein
MTRHLISQLGFPFWSRRIFSDKGGLETGETMRGELEIK